MRDEASPRNDVSARPGGSIRSVFVISLLVTAAIWSNNRMLEHLAGYDLFRLVDLAREFRFVEVAIVAIFFAVAFRRSRSQTWQERFRPLRWPLLVLGLGLLGGFVNGVGILDSLQGLYLFLSPVLVFLTARWLGVDLTTLRTMRKTVFTIILASLPAWIYQVLVYFMAEANGDNVNGLFSDSHVLANLTYCAGLYAVGGFLVSRRLSWLLLAGGMFFMGLLAVNEKSTIFVILILFVLIALSQSRSARMASLRMALIIAVAVSGVAWAAFSAFGEGGGLELRTDVLLTNDLQDIGTVIAYIQLPDVFAEAPEAALVGVGAGNYGSAIALRKHVEGTATDLSRRFVGDLEVAGLIGAFAWQTNYFVGMLVEYGIVFTVLILLCYVSIWRQSVAVVRRDVLPELKIWALGVAGSLLLLGLTALVANISNFDEAILAFPVMIAAAGVHNELERRPRPEAGVSSHGAVGR